MARERDGMAPHEALADVRAIEARVRSTARWHGWAWLAVALLTPVFLVVTASGPSPSSLWTAVGFMLVGGALWLLESRRPLRGRAAARVDSPATIGYVVAVVAVTVVGLALDPDGTEPWYMALALLPAMPCLVAAWLVLRR